MVRLIGQFHVISNAVFTHPWDANAYLVTGAEPTLIDCGGTLGYPALKAALAQFGYAPRDIRRVIATHGHWDHISGMAELRAESDAELWLHAGDREAVEAGDVERTSAFLYGQQFPPLTVDRLLYDGETLAVGPYALQVVHTPGHSPGSVCLLTEINGLKLLIAGDTLWGGFHQRICSDLDAWSRSLDRLLLLDYDVITSGHCPPTLLFDAKLKVAEARQQFGVFFVPWFKPFHLKFVYRGPA
jgi:glyoxylase-like metal-dependent hydrolase (beta-lactamase superfamily II)